MSVVKNCIHARMTKSLRCNCGRKICAGDQCSEFIPYEVEREPTGHAWIKITDKYFKRTMPGRYEKAIITFGRTYICCIDYSVFKSAWVLDVLVDGNFVVSGAHCSKISIAINIGSDTIKHLIAADINRVPKKLRAEDAPRDKHLAVARPAGTPA